MRESAIEKTLKLKQQYEDSKQAAVQELLKERSLLDTQVSELGYEVHTNGNSRRNGSKGQRRCKVCGDLGHDKRKCPQVKAA